MALTPTEREEHFFKAMVDAADGNTPEELEPTERREHWYKEIIDAIKAGGGGSGGGVLVVHETVSGRTHTLDKTWQEIFDADEAIIVYVADDYKRFLGVSAVDLYNGVYEVQAYNVSLNGNISVKLYTTDSANGYPAVSE